MVVIRGTKRLLSRLRVDIDPTPAPSSARLGDWYANLLPWRPRHLVLFVAEKSLLSVVVEAAPWSTLLGRLRLQLSWIFAALGVPRGDAVYELDRMRQFQFATTSDRQILGSMTDFAWLLKAQLEAGDDLMQASLKLAEAPCSPIGMRGPGDVTRGLLIK